uniref:Uncharacterized protein n=1 Tax=Callorhinchus milii TaxID=7868 RepID=A0A4W3GJB5_CALMI
WCLSPARCGAAWLPGPILYGRVIDKTCIHWETKCGEQTACRYYDLDRFRIRYMGVQVLFECGALICFFAASYFVTKRHNRRS